MDFAVLDEGVEEGAAFPASALPIEEGSFF